MGPAGGSVTHAQFKFPTPGQKSCNVVSVG